MPPSLYLYFIAISVIVGLLSLRYGLSKPLRLFLIFLGYTLVNELVAFKMMSIGQNNHWLYNIYNYIRFPVLPLIYLYIIQSPGLRKAIQIFVLATPVFLAINLFIYQGFSQLHTIYILTGATFIIVLTVGYLRQLFFLPIEDSIISNSFFWISSGLLFYHLASAPFLGAVNYLIHNQLELAKQLYLIVQIMNLFMYSLFTIAFLITWNRRKSPILS